MKDKPYHEIKERCIGHGMEWRFYVQKNGSSARIILEPNGIGDKRTAAFAWQIDPDIAEVLLSYE